MLVDLPSYNQVRRLRNNRRYPYKAHVLGTVVSQSRELVRPHIVEEGEVQQAERDVFEGEMRKIDDSDMENFRTLLYR